jgi:hypothetical protein
MLVVHRQPVGFLKRFFKNCAQNYLNFLLKVFKMAKSNAMNYLLALDDQACSMAALVNFLIRKLMIISCL